MPFSYNNNNVFAKILRKEIPSFMVYENENTLAIMDIMPAADGHVLVLPKASVRNILDCPTDLLQELVGTVQLMSRSIMHAFAAQGVTIWQFNESAGGQEVFHLHFHIIPRHEGIKLRHGPRAIMESSRLSQHADMIRAACDNLRDGQAFSSYI